MLDIPPPPEQSDAPSEKAPISPAAPGWAAKAHDLDMMRSAVDAAAGVSAGLWLSYLFVLFYFLVAVGSVTHKDLFLESSLKLPIVNVDLPLLGFFVLGPLIFLVVHAYVLLNFRLLADKVRAFDDELHQQVDPDHHPSDIRERLRRQLPNDIFVQFLAGPRVVRHGVIGVLLKLIAWISLVIGPVALLVFFELRFLPFHSVWITWWQRLAVLLDLVLLWLLWPAVVLVMVRSAWRQRVGIAAAGLASAVPLFLVFLMATIPGEWQERQIPSLPLLLAEFWSNTLVLPGLDVVDHAKLDSEAKIAALRETVSLAGRDLRGAELYGAGLRKVDFTGADLRGAVLLGADLQQSNLRGARLVGALLDGAQLQGADLRDAHLQAAWLDLADLKGASLEDARLEEASLAFAHLQGAYLGGAHLEGAVLFRTDLKGVDLSNAHLRGAMFDGAQLQGAWLDHAELQGASLERVFAWRASITGATGIPRVSDIVLEPKQRCDGRSVSKSVCDWRTTSLKRDIEQAMPPPGLRGREMDSQRVDLDALDERLDPNRSIEEGSAMAQEWRALANSPLTVDDVENQRGEEWRKTGCAAAGAPYVLASISVSIKMAFQTEVRQRIAAAFLDPACAGARGMSDGTRRRLAAIVQPVAPDAAKVGAGSPPTP